MSDTSKEKIIQINTTGATKNVKSLKTQIKELKEQLAQLEVGTAEYNQIAKQLADTNQKSIEINEAMKYSNQDLGQTLSNLSAVSAGVIGAIQGINVVMQLFGASEEDASKATKSLQQSMALIQSLTAIDNARKSFEGLKNAFTDLGKSSKDTDKLSSSEERLSNSVKKTTAAETRETATLNTNTKAKKTNTTATTAMATKTNVARTAVTTLTTGIKNMTKALLSNPFTIFMAASAAAITVITNLIQKNKELKESAEEHKKAEEERALALNNLPNDFNLIENSVKWANSGMEELTNSSSKLYKEIQELAGEIQRQEPDKKSRAWQVAFSRAYEDAVKAGDKEKKNLIELTKLQWEYYRVNRANYESYADYLKAQDEALAKLYSTYISQSKSTTTNTTNTVKKSVKELIELFRELRKEILNTSLSFKGLKNAFGSIYSETDQLMDKIENIIKTHELDKVLSEQFKHALYEERGILNDLSKYEVTLDFIFDRDSMNKLESELIAAEKDLDEKYKQYQEKKTKPTEMAYEAQKKIVEELKRQVTVYNELAVAVQKYVKAVNEENEKRGEKAYKKRLAQLEKEKEIYLSNWTDILANNPWAEYNDTLLTTTSSLEDIRTELEEMANEEISIGLSDEDAERMRELKRMKDELADSDKSMIERMKEWRELSKEINEIEQRRVLNQDAHERLDEIFERRQELEIQQIELERTLARTEHEIRLKYIEEEYEARKEDTKAEVQNLHNNRSASGGGVEDYNTEVDALNLEMQAIKDQAKYVEDYYQRIMDTVTEGSEQWVQLEIEKQAALTQLEEDGAEKRAEITQAEVERKKKIQQTYMNALSSVTGEIQNLLGEKMNAYDADSKEYKRLQIAQATINTLSGTLAAFVSGFQSGIPWPGNLALALLLSRITFATGRQSIENIKNESLKNSSTSTATSGNFGEYDTLSYMNDIDLIDSISDQRVYVTENDITTTQNRVQVRESEATF